VGRQQVLAGKVFYNNELNRPLACGRSLISAITNIEFRSAKIEFYYAYLRPYTGFGIAHREKLHPQL